MTPSQHRDGKGGSGGSRILKQTAAAKNSLLRERKADAQVQASPTARRITWVWVADQAVTSQICFGPPGPGLTRFHAQLRQLCSYCLKDPDVHSTVK